MPAPLVELVKLAAVLARDGRGTVHPGSAVGELDDLVAAMIVHVDRPVRPDVHAAAGDLLDVQIESRRDEVLAVQGIGTAAHQVRDVAPAVLRRESDSPGDSGA